MKIQFEPDKFAELTLYISSKCAGDPNFGATKLNKILFFADFLAFRKWLKPITNATYQKLDHGPAPKCMLPVREQLVAEGRLEIQEVGRFGFTQKRPVALQDANLKTFTADEIALVDDVIDALRDANTASVSEFSHGFWWQVAKAGEEIPIEVSLVELPDEASTEEIKHAESLQDIAGELIGAN
ncbi:MAG TPA: Panacea domain-containing protein [Tepidisphaeraceae bacterium]|nr:Panacea domain-containing protein [Tepidisphaeraceae bacterium]